MDKRVLILRIQGSYCIGQSWPVPSKLRELRVEKVQEPLSQDICYHIHCRSFSVGCKARAGMVAAPVSFGEMFLPVQTWFLPATLSCSVISLPWLYLDTWTIFLTSILFAQKMEKLVGNG